MSRHTLGCVSRIVGRRLSYTVVTQRGGAVKSAAESKPLAPRYAAQHPIRRLLQKQRRTYTRLHMRYPHNIRVHRTTLGNTDDTQADLATPLKFKFCMGLVPFFVSYGAVGSAEE